MSQEVHTGAWDDVFRLRRSGRPAEALNALESVWKREDGTLSVAASRLRASLLGQLADTSMAEGRTNEAERFLRAALGDAPRFPDLHYRYGRVRASEGDERAARESWKLALSLAPLYVAPRIELALLDARQGRLGEAIAALDEMAKRRLPDDLSRFHTGLERLRLGDWEGAAPALRSAYGELREDVKRELVRVGRLVDAGRPSEALHAARILRRRVERFPDVALCLGLVYRALGWWDDAREVLSEAVRLHPRFHEARTYLAAILFAQGDSVLAEAELETLLADEPDYAPALALLRERGGTRGRDRFERGRQGSPPAPAGLPGETARTS